MSRAVKFAVFAPIAAFLSGCETPPPAALVAPPPARDRLYTPAEITPGRLQYAREPDAFAPVLTDRVAYPTQEQANNAFARENMASSYPTKGPYVIRASDPLPTERRATSLRLFACKPGVLNSVTGRIVEPQRPCRSLRDRFSRRAGQAAFSGDRKFLSTPKAHGGCSRPMRRPRRRLGSIRSAPRAILSPGFRSAKDRRPIENWGENREAKDRCEAPTDKAGGGHLIERLIFPELCASFCNGAFDAR